MADNSALTKAAKARQDEFYSQLSDVEAELRHYRKHFKGKVVFCNADDPYESAFFKYFANNFNYLGLKKLVTTSYAGSPITGKQLPLFDLAGLSDDVPPKEVFKVEITEVPDLNDDGAIDLSDVEYLLRNDKNSMTPLEGDGDFRSAECVALLDEADIVVTNPPFSLFREFIALILEHGKKFLVIGSKNAITYKEIFRLVKSDQVWLGHGFTNGNAFFRVPESYQDQFVDGVFDAKTGLVKFRNVGWFTNLDNAKRHEPLTLYKRFSPDDFVSYDNYDAIEVSKVADIPYDYPHPMGVPITFLDSYSPDQFEVLMMANGNARTNTDPKALAFVNYRRHPEDKGGLGILAGQRVYARILIRNRKPETAEDLA
jgi:hypothetical protein